MIIFKIAGLGIRIWIRYKGPVIFFICSAVHRSKQFWQAAREGVLAGRHFAAAGI